MPTTRCTNPQLALGLKPRPRVARPVEAVPRLVKAERERQLAEILAEVQRTKTHAAVRVGRMRIYAYRRADGRVGWTINYRGRHQRGVTE